MKKKYLLFSLMLFMFLSNASFMPAYAITTLSGVPAYYWYHGCGPTAAASVLGYWDLHGYGNLFTASSSDIYWTSNVQDQISSPAHNAKYDDTDNPNLSEPEKTSIADWFETSIDPKGFGVSYLMDAPAAFEGYASFHGYTFDSYFESYLGGLFTWNDLVSEINAGHPMMFLVDSNKDGGADHFVPVFGYDDRGNNDLWYALYDTYDEEESIIWKQFQGMGSGIDYGVGSGIFVAPVSPPDQQNTIPEPAALLLLSFGLIGLAGLQCRFKWNKTCNNYYGQCRESLHFHRQDIELIIMLHYCK